MSCMESTNIINGGSVFHAPMILMALSPGRRRGALLGHCRDMNTECLLRVLGHQPLLSSCEAIAA